MAHGIRGRVLQANQAGRTVGSLADAQDPSVTALTERVLVEHLHLNGEVGDRVHGGVGEISRTEPFGGRGHEVFHERDGTRDGGDGREVSLARRLVREHRHARGSRLRRIGLVSGEAVAPQRRPLGERAPVGGDQRLNDDVLEAGELTQPGTGRIAEGGGIRDRARAGDGDRQLDARHVDALEGSCGSGEPDRLQRGAEALPPLRVGCGLVGLRHDQKDRIGVGLESGDIGVRHGGEGHVSHPRFAPVR